MAAWPSVLPQYFLVSSLQGIQFQPGSVTFPTDIGPGISRQRTTAVSEFFTGDMMMSPGQYASVKDFYRITLLFGSQSFTWIHPVTGVAVTMKFNLNDTSHLTISDIPRSDLWKIHLSFEILP